MTEMSPAEEVFFAALEKATPAEQAAYLDEACAGNPALRGRVEKLLAARPRVGSFLESRAAQDVTGTYSTDEKSAVSDASSAVAGTVVASKYKLLEQIGEGGMGVVYMAEQQEPIRRTVALKIIKPGMDNGQVLARFEAERQALALMDHPNIAKVLDAGTTDDCRPFFVMELVKGTPITQFCDERRLTPRERLELFVSVCQAIQHAHQKGVIHRDIKPSNVLVALYDDKPVPKVIDFGVAKATGLALTEKTLKTSFGAIIGTPEYMSPEQATFNQLDIDTRSDVYALGVLLYELLTGSTPVDKTRFKEAALLEVLRVVREEEPPRPSVKLSTAQARASIAATRGIEADKLTQLLRGELDWIVMKSLEKDRNRRYETPAGLGRDVDRYLKDEVVEAQPPSVSYRLRKFVKRNRRTVLGVALVLLMLLGGTCGTTWGLFAARRERDDADRARLDADRSRLDETTQRRLASDNEAKAIAAKDDAGKALTRSEGMRLLLQSELSRPSNPSLALLLAIEGAERHPGLLANNTLLAALDHNREERTLPVSGQSLCLSGDGRSLVLISPWTCTIWDRIAGREVVRFAENERMSDGSLFAASNQYFNAACFDPEGKRVLTTSTYGRVRLWDAATGKALDLLVEGRMRGTWTAEDEAIRRSGKDYAAPAQFSTDGRFILTTYGKARVWDARTGKEHLVLEDHASPVFWSSFSKDGKKIITASRDRTARIWDAASGKQLQEFKGHSTNALLMACFNSDGTRALTVASIHSRDGADTNDPLCRLWDVETGKELATLGGPEVGRFEPYASQAQFSSDGSRVLTYDYFSMVEKAPCWHLWDARSGKHLGRIKNQGQAVFSPDGERVAFFGQGKVVELWNVKTIERIENLEHGSGVSSAIFSSDGQRLLTVDGVGVHTWAIAGEAERRLGRWMDLPYLAVSQDGRSLATRTHDPQEIAIWDLATAREINRIKGKDFSEVTFARFSFDGSKVIFGRHGYGILGRDRDGTACVGDVRTSQIVTVLPGGLDGLRDADISPDNLRAVTINPGARLLRIWDLTNGKEFVSLKLAANDSFTAEARFSPDGRWLVTNEHTGHHIRDAATTKDLAVLKDGAPPPSLLPLVHEDDRAIFSPDSRRVLTTHAYSNPQVARVWETATGKELATLRLPQRTGDYGTTEFSNDGEWIIMACPDRAARIFETATGKEIRVLGGHDQMVSAASFSPDKTHAVTASADKTVRLWDTRTGELQAVFQGHQEAVVSARFIPEGRILSVDKNGSARVWPVDPLPAARARTPRQLTTQEREHHEVPSTNLR